MNTPTALGLIGLLIAGPAAARQRVLVGQARAVGEVDAATLATVSELVTQALADDPRYQVLAAAEASAIARALVDEGCEDRDCLGEIAGAMGVDHVVLLLLARTPAGYRLELGWLEVASQRLRDTRRVEVASLEALPDRLPPVVAALAIGEPTAAAPPLPAAAVEAPSPPEAAGPSWRVVGAALGSGAALGVGGLTLALGLGLRELLVDASTRRPIKDAIVVVGPLLVVAGSGASCLLLGTGACLGGLALVE